MAQIVNYSLPEFVFLDGNAPEGNTLQDRTVLQHIESCTILEVLHLNSMQMLEMQVPLHRFEYINLMGVSEQHAFAVHFSLGEQEDLEQVIEKCREWYCEYLSWEDRNIQKEGHEQGN